MENFSIIQILEYVASFGFFFLSYWAKGNMDFSAKGGFKGVELYKNKDESWERKYSYPLRPYEAKWYYFGLVKPDYKESFLYSSTAFVFVSDYWHFQQFIFLNSATLGTYFILEGDFIRKIIVVAIIELLYFIGFNTSYERRK